MAPKVTAKDIANYLHLSQATVSMVFRGRVGISQETRERVFHAAKELGYEYHASSGRVYSNRIHFVLYKRHGKIMSDTPFFEQLTQGVSEKAQELGYQLSVSYFYGSQSPMEQIRSIESTECTGIIILATEMRSADLSAFESLDVPIVLLDNWYMGKPYDSVVIDNKQGAWIATQYLMHKGHTRLGYLSSSVPIRNFSERNEGYQIAIRSIKVPDNHSDVRIVKVGTTSEAAYNDMAAFLASEPVLPTAFFADNDIIASGCIRALQKAGYRVPEEVSVIGFDNIPLCELITPRLTTVAVPKARMGALTVEQLDRRIRGVSGSETVRISVCPEIVERESVLDFSKI